MSYPIYPIPGWSTYVLGMLHDRDVLSVKHIHTTYKENHLSRTEPTLLPSMQVKMYKLVLAKWPTTFRVSLSSVILMGGKVMYISLIVSISRHFSKSR